MFAPSQLELLPAAPVPALLAPDARAKARTLEFFTAHIRNPNTRKAYARAGQHFADWCARFGVDDVRRVEPVHVALYVEQLDLAAPSVKQRLAALRSLFDWLVVGQVMPINPAAAVRATRSRPARRPCCRRPRCATWSRPSTPSP